MHLKEHKEIELTKDIDISRQYETRFQNSDVSENVQLGEGVGKYSTLRVRVHDSLIVYKSSKSNKETRNLT